MRVVFFGTPDFAVPSLEALGDASHPILAVVTQPEKPRGRGLAPSPSPVKRAALRRGLRLLEPARLRGELAASLAPLAPDALVVVAYGKILPRELLGLAPRGAINVHGSLLPRHRGASPVQAAILAGDASTGVSTMLMDEGLDTGPVLLCRETPIAPGETAGELAARLAALGAELLVETLARLEKGGIEPRAQDEALASYAPRIRAEDAVLDWSQPAALLARRVRAYSPWPGASTRLPAGKRLKVLRAEPGEGQQGVRPGTVLEASRAAIRVACGEGALVLREAQPEGKKPLAAADLVNGRYLGPGDRLGA